MKFTTLAILLLLSLSSFSQSKRDTTISREQAVSKLQVLAEQVRKDHPDIAATLLGLAASMYLHDERQVARLVLQHNAKVIKEAHYQMYIYTLKDIKRRQ